MYCIVLKFALYLQNKISTKTLKNMNNRNLYRPSDDMIVAGVCSGVARYFGLDETIIRIVTLLLIIFGGLSLWVYIILWIITPRR